MFHWRADSVLPSGREMGLEGKMACGGWQIVHADQDNVLGGNWKGPNDELQGEPDFRVESPALSR